VIHRRFRLLLFLILLALFLSLLRVGAGRPTPQRASLPSIALRSNIEPQLLKQALSAPDEPLRFVVHLRERADLRPSSREPDRLARRRWVVQALQGTARRSQTSIQTYLSARQATGHVRSFIPCWIFNGLAVIADTETLLELAQRPEVEIIRLDRKRRLSPLPEQVQPVLDQWTGPSAGVEWNIQRIGADLVWEALDIDGTGVVVANMDTGVDWEHPALHSRYRGYNPKGFDQHRGNWFCATDEGYLYPGDGHGHGTHTMGVMVGREGESSIGVAPGAQWIAVKAFDNGGYSYDSWLHSGFQWLLAPEGDVTLAPEVVNNSWGTDVGADTTFQPDVQALRAAGILPIFSAGNNGPGGGTVGSPASFPEALAVGATDPEDQIASFSSRGPSPWAEVKPELVAPGVDVRSSVPGGAYALSDGTSMAAPHVAGAAALLLQARPSLTVTETEQMLTDSALPLGERIPNNDYGWGLAEAYEAVAVAMDAATISGTVRQAADGFPLTGATVRCTAFDGERRAEVATDYQGHYQLLLAAGTYSLTASAFAYYPQIKPRLVLTSGQELVQDFALHFKPAGVLMGRVTEAGTGSPLSATLEVVNTPAQTQSDSQSGLYSLALPIGTYTLSVKAPGHRVGWARAFTITADEVVRRDFALDPAPTILVVDSGPWYYGSEIRYFTQALDELGQLYDLWSIQQPFAYLPDIPSAEDLMSYDVVIWSAPQDSPGYIGADGAIVDFLEGGGLLFLTGQDIGYWDGGGGMTFAPYFRDYLKARYVEDDSGVRMVTGLAGDLFAGLSFGIQDGDGAGNQFYPDEIEVANPDYAASVLRYQGDGSAGQQVGLCRPYRVLYVSFGFEAIDSRIARQQVMDRALSWLASPRPPAGVELQVSSREPQVATAASMVTHTLRLRNTGDGGEGDVYEVFLGPSAWSITLTPLILDLAPCQSTTLTVEVAIPAGTEQDITQQVTITARSQQEAGLSQAVTLTTKTPAPVLLVDDDRWYDQEPRYQAALEGAGIAYDNWEVGWKGRPANGSPSSPTLAMYPILVWFTGYDWYETLTAEEEARLAEYLSQGGRLFLSSQDYLFTRGLSPFGIDYLGVLTYTEDLSTMVALGVEGSPVGDGLGSYELIYPFTNWSDALTPTLAAQPSFLGGHGYPIALTLQHERASAFPGLTARIGKTAFFAFPLEALPHGPMAEVMGRTVGWLSWLGDSSLAVDKSLAGDGERLTYTAVLQNDGSAEVQARFEGAVPTYTTYVSGSVSGGATYEGGQVVWDGPLEPQSAITLSYQVEIEFGLPPGTWVNNLSRVGYADGKLIFPRRARTRVNAPDLFSSRILADRDEVKSGETLTYQVSVRNEGLVDAPAASLTTTVPSVMKVISDSLAAEGGGQAVFQAGRVLWSGPVSVGHSVTITYQSVATQTVVDLRAVTPVEINDGLGVSLQREAIATISPYRCYLLLIWKRWGPPGGG